MKSPLLASLVLAFALTALAADSGAPAAPVVIRELLTDFLTHNSDPARHENFWADDLVYTSAMGVVHSKAVIMKSVWEAGSKPPALTRPVLNQRGPRPRLYGRRHHHPALQRLRRAHLPPRRTQPRRLRRLLPQQRPLDLPRWPLAGHHLAGHQGPAGREEIGPGAPVEGPRPSGPPGAQKGKPSSNPNHPARRPQELFSDSGFSFQVSA